MTEVPAIDAAEIARRAKSNLAFALAFLPAERRRDMVTFYAFCRLVDDIADEDGFSLKDRRIQLGAWRRIVRREQEPANDLARELVDLPAKYDFAPSLLEEIIDGVSMDLETQRFQTFDDLKGYCYKVASAVGLVSLPIFGVPPPQGQDYAVNLGYALQLTNILRDVGIDWENGRRVYLPAEDMARFGYTEADLAAGRHTPEFVALMEHEAARAGDFFAAATAAFPKGHRRQLQAAEAMRHIYNGILWKMRRDKFRVFGHRYRLSLPRKVTILVGSWWRSFF